MKSAAKYAGQRFYRFAPWALGAIGMALLLALARSHL